MTYTTFLKEEISKIDQSPIEDRQELEAFIRCTGKINNDEIVITLENASVTRKIYKDIKKVFNISPLLKVRVQRRFRVKQIYIITIKEKLDEIKSTLKLNKFKLDFDSNEEKIAFLKGAFLGIGNITNPQTSRYHLEFICSDANLANMIDLILIDLGFKARIVSRGYKYVVYIKSADNISDLLKMFKATEAMFYFEDIRIYRDHKNMVNRINNCEVSNQTKAIVTGQKQLEEIDYLEKNDLIDLLDEKQKIVIDARKKYPESTLAEIANIISLEYNYPIGKSGVNHHFIKIGKMVKQHKENNEAKNEN